MIKRCFHPAGAELELRIGFVWVIQFFTPIKWSWAMLFSVLLMYYCFFSSRFSLLVLKWINKLPTAGLDTSCKHCLGRDTVS